MQYSVHVPSAYLLSHATDLLPNWSQPIASVLILLQSSDIDFSQRTPDTERKKNVLRTRFLDIGNQVIQNLHCLNYSADLFDPATGKPIHSPSGRSTLDDVAIAHAVLGYPTYGVGGCSIMLHPAWGTSVYPSTLVSSAPPDVLQQVADAVLQPSHSVAL